MIDHIHDKIIALPIEVLNQRCTMYNRLCKDKLFVWLGTNTAQPQLLVLNWSCRYMCIKWLHGANREDSVCNGTRKDETELGEDGATEHLHNDRVVSFMVMKTRAAVDQVFVLLPVDL